MLAKLLPHIQMEVFLSHRQTRQWLVCAFWFRFIFSCDLSDSPAEGLDKWEDLVLTLGFLSPVPSMCHDHSLHFYCMKKELASHV